MQNPDPPKENNFQMHLRWHLDHGTRPSGERRPWDKLEFVRALIEIRRLVPGQLGRRKSEETGLSEEETSRTLNGWLRGSHIPHDRPWGVILEQVLFGQVLGKNPVLDEWRGLFTAARRGTIRIDESYVVEPALSDSGKRQAIERVIAGLQRQNWRLDILGRGEGCTNPEFNEQLVLGPPRIEFEVRPGKWTARGDEQSEHLLEVALHQKKGDKNPDLKLRVASDFINQSRVELQQTDYFASLMTDQLAWQRVRSKQVKKDGVTPQILLSDGIASFIDKRSGELMSLECASVSNQLGASLLGFTSDGHLLIVYQNDKNNQSANTLAPSGSGSLDWEDVENSRAEDFISVVIFGAERELREECRLDPTPKGQRRIASMVMLTGFVRMLHRAGKPEFYGIARMDGTADEIVNRKRERYVDRVMPSGVRPADFKRNRPSAEVARICKEYLDKVFKDGELLIPLSYPLEHSLQLTNELCGKESTASVIDAFFRKPFSTGL